jgi:hypothetical protein
MKAEGGRQQAEGKEAVSVKYFRKSIILIFKQLATSNWQLALIN